MVKAMGFSSAVRTHRAFGWLSIIWLTSAVSIAGGQDMQLQAEREVVTTCGGNVTLTCDASASRQMDIKLFSWLGRNKTMCQYGNDLSDTGVLCENSGDASRHRLALTLINVMPVSEGKYLCKIQAKLGVEQASTALKIQDCLEEPGYRDNETHVVCWFTGVYPRGVVHWSHGDVNLTDSASIWQEEDQHGRFNVFSSLQTEKGREKLPYTCSLWIPSKDDYLSSQHVIIMDRLISSGSTVRLHCLLVMVWTITLF